MVLDVVFPVYGELLPIDHVYALYQALVHHWPLFRDPRSLWRFAPINGRPIGRGLYRLSRDSVLRLRLPETDVWRVLSLSGQMLNLGGWPIRLGKPGISTLVPATAVRAWLVTFCYRLDANQFLQLVRWYLSQLGIAGESQIPLNLRGPARGLPQKRFIHIRGQRIVGYTLIITHLRAHDALRLQTFGFGKHTRFGCGFFSPLPGDRD
jgi:CRISPR-associated protein Cas6